MKRARHSISTLLSIAALSAGCATAVDSGDPDAPGTDIDASAMPDTGIPADVDAATLTDAATPPDGCVLGWVELLQNGDFDLGDSGWVSTTNGGTVIRQTTSPWPPHTPDYWALFLGYSNAMQTLRQTVTIPATATDLRLQGYRCWVTEEGAGMFDFLDIDLRNASDDVLETLWARDNTHAGAVCSWNAFQRDAIDAFAGQTVDLVFTATSDNAAPTSFGFDSLSLAAYACL